MLTTLEACLLLVCIIEYLLLMWVVVLKLSRLFELLLFILEPDRSRVGHVAGVAVLLIWTLLVACQFSS